jgi:hypothetical protein
METKSGRWNSPDPYRGSASVSAPQSLNRYHYVNNDPTNGVDPLGFFTVCVQSGVERSYDGGKTFSVISSQTICFGGAGYGDSFDQAMFTARGLGGPSGTGTSGGRKQKDKNCTCPETTVNIWDYQGSTVAWGHASVTLSDGTHLSWWPAPDRRERWVWPLGDIYEVAPNKNQSFDRDVELEGRQPDRQIKISGLNEAAIKKWWTGFKDSGEKWKSISQNCSTVSFLALSKGFSGTIPTNLFPNAAWTPADVDALAKWLKGNSKCECKPKK